METALIVLLVILAIPVVLIASGVALWVGIKLLFAAAVTIGTFAAAYIGLIFVMYVAEVFGFLPAGMTAEFWNQTVILFDQAIQMINEARVYK